jgi:hypothetical protein
MQATVVNAEPAIVKYVPVKIADVETKLKILMLR